MRHFRSQLLAASAALILALAVSGCISIGQEFRPEQKDLIKVGDTTDKDVLKIMGNPMRTGTAEDGAKEWTYAHYSASMFGKFSGRDLVVKFDDGGKVKSVSYHTTDPNEGKMMK